MDECINHTGAVNSSGYGGCRYRGIRVGRHVAAYCKAHGVHPTELKGRVVMHSCDNRRCINPEHLSLGTQSQNIKDAVRRKRMPQMTGEHSRKLTDEDIAYIKTHYERGRNQYNPGNSEFLAKLFGVDEQHIRKIARGYYDAH